MKIKDVSLGLIIIFILILALIYGKSLLIPFVLALMIWFVLKAIRMLILRFYPGKKALPSWIAGTFSFIVVFGLLSLVGKILASNINKISDILPEYQANIESMIALANAKYNIDLQDIFKNYTGNFDFSTIIKGLINSVSDLLGSAFMVIIYVIFLLLEEAVFPAKLKAIFKDSDQFSKVHDVINKLNRSINSYISLKTVVSLITASLSYMVLLIIGVDFAFFWAFLIFTFNYIPTIGSIVATLFPATIALIQYSSYSHFFLVLLLIGAVQIAVGNFLEPKIMGQSLNISPLVVILSLMFWGMIWGVIGMLLSVPVTVVLIIILGQFEKTKSIAILLSSKGEVRI